MICAAILAAGASTRLGRPKQLEPLRGEPLLRVVTREVLAAGVDATAIVLGAQAAAIRPAVADLAVTLLDNAAWAEGMGTSLRVAAAWAMAQGSDRLVVCVCDQPRLTRAHVDALLAAAGPIVASRYAGALGVPAVFDRSELPALAQLGGDTGARALLRAPGTIAIDWPDGAFDIDTPADARRL